MSRLLRYSSILGFGAVVLALPAFSARSGGTCGADGRILTRTDLLSRLGANAVIEDFEAYTFSQYHAAVLQLACLDDTSVANGQGPGLVQPGATYCDPVGVELQWNDHLYFQLTTKSILCDNSVQIRILYTQPVTAMGVDLAAFIGYPYTGTATIYDTANNALGTVSIALTAGGAERFFLGWANAAGIGRVDIFSGTYAWSPIIDDHVYGVCNSGPGTAYCTANANSTGLPAILTAAGSASASAGDLTLASTPVPNQHGVFFHGTSQSQLPFGNGFLCAAGGIVRGAVIAGAGNFVSYTYDNSDVAHSLAAFVGTTRNFQHWFRDNAGGGAFFNTSSALSITITP